MRHLTKFAVIAILLLISSCRPSTPQVLPTLIPSPTTPPTPTATATEAETATPSGPTATPPYVPQTIANDPTQQVYVRIVHAALDVPTLDVYIELLAIATNLNFAQNSEPNGIVAGDYVLRVVPAGTAPTDSPLLEQPISLVGGQSLMLLISGSADNLTISTFNEPNEPLSLGESRLTVIHALTGGPAISVTEGSSQLIPPLNFGEVSAPVTLTSGLTTVAFQDGATTLISQPIDLREKYNHTLVLVGRPDDIAVVSYDVLAPSRASIRIINASEPIGNVDMYLDDLPIAEDAAFGRPTEYHDTLAQVYTTSIYAAGVDRTQIEPLVTGQLTVNPDDSITLIVLGPPDDLRLLDYRDNAAPTPLGEARLALLNTLPNLPTVFFDSGEESLGNITELNYGQMSFETPVLAGDHTFYWSNSDGDLVEVAENIELEAGRSYLYLFTGRLDNAPLVVSNNVGIDESLASLITVTGDDTEATETSSSPTQIRVVNAISGSDLPIDFTVDDTVVAPGLTYRQGSDLITLDRGDHTFSIRLPETTDILATTDSFLEDSRFSIFASGVIGSGLQMLVVPDYPLIFDGQSPHLRLINLSSNADVRLGLAYAPANPAIQNPDGVSAESEDERRSFSFGIQRLIDNVEWQNFSSVVLMPIGSFDIYIADSNQNTLAAVIPSVVLEAGAHYDIVAYQEMNSQRVHAFVLEYPTRSG